MKCVSELSPLDARGREIRELAASESLGWAKELRTVVVSSLCSQECSGPGNVNEVNYPCCRLLRRGRCSMVKTLSDQDILSRSEAYRLEHPASSYSPCGKFVLSFNIANASKG